MPDDPAVARARTAVETISDDEWTSTPADALLRRLTSDVPFATIRALAELGHGRAAFLVGHALEHGLEGARRCGGHPVLPDGRRRR
jgi:hypothetical protein